MKSVKIILWAFSCVCFVGSCAITQKTGENTIQSRYQESNRLTKGAYTSFYNRYLRISEDLYAIYIPHDGSNYLAMQQFNADRKLIQQKVGTAITSPHFVFQLQGKKGELSTRFYYIPNIQLAANTIKGIKFKNKTYHLYSIPTENGQIIQLFTLNGKSKEKKKDYSAECNAMIQKLCYKDYYKVTQSADSILIDLSISKFSDNKLRLGQMIDTTFIKTTHHRIISIPFNRKYATVSFQFSPHIQKLIASGETVQLFLVDKKQFLQHPLKTVPLLMQNLHQSLSSLEIEVSYRDYMVIVADSLGNIYEAICLNVW
ncbi:MAG: hypothetical protein RSC28_03180 [Bacteroidales bacterium]